MYTTSVANSVCRAARRPSLVRESCTSSSAFISHHNVARKIQLHYPLWFTVSSSCAHVHSCLAEITNGSLIIMLKEGEHPMSADENKALMRRFVEEILNNGNRAVAHELVAEDYVELVPFPGQQAGREGLLDTIAMVRAAFPYFTWTIEVQVAERKKVASSGSWRGTHQGMFLGIPPTGKQVKVPCMV